jgi:hypothetical protein
MQQRKHCSCKWDHIACVGARPKPQVAAKPLAQIADAVVCPLCVMLSHLLQLEHIDDYLPPWDLWAVSASALLGLHHMHSHGIVHNDVKLSNIICVDGVFKLIDMGCCSYLTEDSDGGGRHACAVHQVQAEPAACAALLVAASTAAERQGLLAVQQR